MIGANMIKGKTKKGEFQTVTTNISAESIKQKLILQFKDEKSAIRSLVYCKHHTRRLDASVYEKRKVIGVPAIGQGIEIEHYRTDKHADRFDIRFFETNVDSIDELDHIVEEDVNLMNSGYIFETVDFHDDCIRFSLQKKLVEVENFEYRFTPCSGAYPSILFDVKTLKFRNEEEVEPAIMAWLNYRHNTGMLRGTYIELPFDISLIKAMDQFLIDKDVELNDRYALMRIFWHYTYREKSDSPMSAWVKKLSGFKSQNKKGQ